jgi:hypothetical protein
LPFVDVFRMSRPWISQRKGTGWGLAEFYDSTPAEYPKLEATLRWAREHGQPVDRK